MVTSRSWLLTPFSLALAWWGTGMWAEVVDQAAAVGTDALGHLDRQGAGRA
jgi:hypothetical protein